MRKALTLFIALVVTGSLVVNCSSNNGGSPSTPSETHDTESTGDEQLEQQSTENEEEVEEEVERLANLRPNTGLNLSYINGDFNIADVQQVIVLDYEFNITRVITENRYFKQSDQNISNMACDIYYYTHDSKSIEQLAAENGMSVQNAILEIAAGVAGDKFGGSYNPDGQWYFRGSFINNVHRCSQSIRISRACSKFPGLLRMA